MPEQKPFPQNSMPSFLLKTVLRAYKMFDVDYKNGKVFAYVYPTDKSTEKMYKWAFNEYMTENGIDPTAFPSLMRLENEVVSMMVSHLRGPDTAVGSFTSGGTESCLLAVKTARDWGKGEKGITQPEIVLASTAHPAWYKGAHYFGLKVVQVPVDSKTFKMNVEEAKKAVNKNTVLIVGSAPSYAHGVVDPIPQLGEIALANDVLLHVDGCIGGFVLPFFRKLGAAVPEFDFQVPGVTSMSVDLHKYAFCPKNASCLIHKSTDLRKYQSYCCVEWPGYPLMNMTISSSKSGGPLAAAWATLHYVGEKGYLVKMKELLDGRTKMIEGINAIPELFFLGSPDSSLICFAAKTVNVFRVADLMKKRGWTLSPQLHFNDAPINIHMTLNPQTNDNAPKILADLKECIELARGYDGSATRTAMAEKVKEWEAAGNTMTPPLMEGIMKLIGLSTTELPEDSAKVNECFDVAPPQLRHQMMSTFMNRYLFVHDEEQSRKEGEEFMAKKVKALKKAALKYSIIAGVVAVGALVGLRLSKK